MAPFVVDRLSASGSPVRTVGGKAANLARLSALGLPVPDFFVLRSEALEAALTAAGLTWSPPPAASIKVPDQVAGTVLEAYDKLVAGGAPHVSVRSSDGDEDGQNNSFAGQFNSFLGIWRSGLLDAVAQCWRSAYSEQALAYRTARKLPDKRSPAFGVIVQRQVFSVKAGVMFTVHPLEPDCAYIEANFGTGESVAGSLVTPDGIALDRASGAVVETLIADKRRMTQVRPAAQGSTLIDVDDRVRKSAVLTGKEASSLFRIGRRIEELFGRPQDIEWAIDPAGIWILQTRPILR
ncbi:MAG: PEP/pyruvate-binding domain-containing protein [Actinomycetota bacterium]